MSVWCAHLSKAYSLSTDLQHSLHLAIVFVHSQPALTHKEPGVSLHMPSAHLHPNKITPPVKQRVHRTEEAA